MVLVLDAAAPLVLTVAGTALVCPATDRPLTYQRIFLQAGLACDHDHVAHVKTVGRLDMHLVRIERQH